MNNNNNPSKDSDFIRPVIDSRSPINTRQEYDSSNGHISQYPQFAVQQSNAWIPHQSNQMPPQYPNYIGKFQFVKISILDKYCEINWKRHFPDKNSHIFNHKENGLQVPDGQESRYIKYKGAMQTLHRALGYSKAG